MTVVTETIEVATCSRMYGQYFVIRFSRRENRLKIHSQWRVGINLRPPSAAKILFLWMAIEVKRSLGCQKVRGQSNHGQKYHFPVNLVVCSSFLCCFLVKFGCRNWLKGLTPNHHWIRHRASYSEPHLDFDVTLFLG